MNTFPKPQNLPEIELNGALACLRDSSGAPLATLLLLLMSASIGGVLKTGASGAYLSMVVLAGLVCAFALHKLTHALGVYLAYCALEGMFKYSTDFSAATYLLKPVLICILLFFTARSRYLFSPPVRSLLIGFLGIAAITIVHPLGAGIAQGVAAFTVWYATPVAMYFVGFWAFRTTQEMRPVIVALLAVATVVSIFAILQFKMGEDWCLTQIPGYTNVGNFAWMASNSSGEVIASAFKPASTTSFGGAASGWAQLGVVVSATMLFWQRSTPAASASTLVALIINMAALVICGVRSIAMVGLIQICASAWLASKSTVGRILSLALLLLVGGLTFFAVELYTDTPFNKRYADTLKAPLQSYGESRGVQYLVLSAFVSQYPFGIGYQRGTTGGTAGYYGGKIVASRETQLNAIAADMGLPGAALLILLLGAMSQKALQTLRLTWRSAAQPLAVLFCLIFLGVVFASATGPAIQGNDFFWFSLGALFSIPRLLLVENQVRYALLSREAADIPPLQVA